jgi:glycosyltransferase involved in cell wall biosynthesis
MTKRDGAAALTEPRTRLVHVATVPTTFKFLIGQPGYMRPRGFDTTVVSAPGEFGPRFAARELVEFLPVPMHRRITPLHDVVAVCRIVRHLRSIKPAIVHAHTPKGGLLGMIAAALTRVPVRIYHIRGLPFVTQKGWRRRMLLATERVSARLATRVLAVSHSMRDIAIATHICAPEKISVIASGSGNGVDSVRFDPVLHAESGARLRTTLHIPETATVISFLGRLVIDKGIRELEGAWQMVRNRYPDAHLIVAGPIESESPLHPELLERLEQDDRVHLPGRIDDPASVFAASNLFVLPTYREGFPNVLLEAASMNLPVVATDIPGCVDAVQNGVTGLLVPPRDADALAEAMIELLEDPRRAAAMGRAARARVCAQFRPETIWQGVHGVYVEELDTSDRLRKQ